MCSHVNYPAFKHRWMRVFIFSTLYFIHSKICSILCKTSNPSQNVSITKFAQSTFRGPFYYPILTLIPAWISNYNHYKVWDEITYPFPNFNGQPLTFGNESNFIPNFAIYVITYPCRGPWLVCYLSAPNPIHQKSDCTAPSRQMDLSGRKLSQPAISIDILITFCYHWEVESIELSHFYVYILSL